MIPALPEVEAYAARILAGIDGVEQRTGIARDPSVYADARRRVERDVEGLRDCPTESRDLAVSSLARAHALRYWTDLTEVGALYGQPWEDVPTIDLFLPPVGEVQP